MSRKHGKPHFILIGQALFWHQDKNIIHRKSPGIILSVRTKLPSDIICNSCPSVRYLLWSRETLRVTQDTVCSVEKCTVISHLRTVFCIQRVCMCVCVCVHIRQWRIWKRERETTWLYVCVINGLWYMCFHLLTTHWCWWCNLPSFLIFITQFPKEVGHCVKYNSILFDIYSVDNWASCCQ